MCSHFISNEPYGMEITIKIHGEFCHYRLHIVINFNTVRSKVSLCDFVCFIISCDTGGIRVVCSLKAGYSYKFGIGRLNIGYITTVTFYVIFTTLLLLQQYNNRPTRFNIR